MTEVAIADLIRRDAPVLSPATPIRRAVAVLVDSGVAGAAVLGDDGVLAGILTQKDCFRPALHASYHREWTGQVADHMSRDVISVDSEEEVIRVAEMFLAHPHRLFPVLSGGAYAGMIHRSDVLAFLARSG